MLGKIQYHKLKRSHYITNQIKSELHARGMGQHFDKIIGWLKLLNILKDNEGNKKYFHPLIGYDSFKWNSSYFDDDGAII